MSNVLKKEIAVVGLGKMGANIVRRLKDKGWNVLGYDPASGARETLASEGISIAENLSALVKALSKPRIIFLMVPAGKAVDDVLFGNEGIARLLSTGDIVIDAGNTYFKDDVSRAEKLAKQGVTFVDVGFSGGPSGARNGGCLMIGGDEATFKKYEYLFRDLAAHDGYQFFKGVGAGHFVKMIHNGIEYGMMQALGEGFAMLKGSDYTLNLTKVAGIYNHGSVIESRLVGWMKSAFEQFGEDLEEVSGSVGHSGEGEWTAKTAREMGIPATIVEESYKFRVDSKQKPSYTGKIVSALRNQFGGHSVKND